jgi:hypothetical protein
MSSHLLNTYKKVCEPYIILKETDAKLKTWSKFGLLLYLQKAYCKYRFRR